MRLVLATLCAGNVHEVRKELQPLEPHYSPGLIWVGREAQAGAQISVSDVRGDVVLWLDGAALGATAFVKNGVRRSCCFLNLQQVGQREGGVVRVEWGWGTCSAACASCNCRRSGWEHVGMGVGVGWYR